MSNLNESINKDTFEKLLNQPRLLRSLYRQQKIFCNLNENNRLEILGKVSEDDTIDLDDFEEANKNFEQIVDDKERAEAYRDLARSLEEILKKDKQDNLKNLEENSKRLNQQQSELEVIQNELKLTSEQLLGSKELINKLSEEKVDLSNSIKLLEQEELKLNKKLNDLENLCSEIDIDELIEKIRQLYPETGPGEEDLNKTIGDIALNLTALKPTIEKAENILQSKLKMQVEAKDVIAGIPMFSGDVKLLDGFLNACELYYGLVDNDNKPTVLKIIKAKITGEALQKAGPFNEDMNTWALLKKRIIEKIKKPVSLEYAQEDLNQVFQSKDESIEDYGNRVRAKLKKLNEASKKMTEVDGEIKILRKMNEKHAISKFEQNIRNQTIKVLVSAAGKTTLDECITFAMQKELIEKNKNIRACAFCGLSGHNEDTCRKKKNGGESSGNFNRKKFNNNNGNGQQNRNFNKNQNFERKQFQDSHKNEQKPSTSGYNPNNSNNFKNRSSNFQRPKYSNNGNEKSNESQKNVKVVAEDENINMTTVKEALREVQNSKN